MDLDIRWDEQWGGLPDGHTLRDRFTDRWVRFHSLPGGQRYARTADARAEVRRRHDTVLTELRTADEPLLVIAQDYAPGDGYHGWVRRALPSARLWREAAAKVDEPESTFWVLEGIRDLDAIDDLMTLVAAGGAGSVIITDSTLEWLYHPYDGGADVITRTTEERDRLRDAHPERLSPRPDGL